MKALLTRHGEKLFFVLVLILAGWSLISSVSSIRRSTTLSAEESRLLGIVQEHHKKNQPSPLKPLTYAQHLEKVFRGHASPALPTGGRVLHAPPSTEYGVLGVAKRTVEGQLFPPSDFEAKPDRGRVTLTWNEANAENVTVVRYEIFRAIGEGELERPKQPLRTVDASEGRPAKRGGGLTYTFTDSPLAAETSYTYWLRALGRPVDDPRLKVEMPSTLEQQEDLWCTPALKVKTRTPSDIEFECSAISLLWGKKHAVLSIKIWDAQQNNWKVFRTDPGIPEGEEIKGFRMVTPVEKETIETGYIVKKILEEIVKVPKEVWEFDETGKKVKVTKLVDAMVQKVIVEHPGKRDVREIVVRAPGAPPVEIPTAPKATPGPAPKSPAPTTGGSILDQLRKQLEKREGEAPASAPTSPATPSAQAVAPTPAPTGVYVFSVPNSPLKLELPATWQGMGPRELLTVIFPCTDDVMETLMKGILAAVTNKSSALTLHDFPISTPELQAIANNDKMSPENKAIRFCEELLRKPILALKSAGPGGDIKTITNSAGSPIASFEATLRGRDGSTLVLVRYCGFSTARVYALSFLCLDKDAGTERKSWEQIASTMTW